MEAFEQQGFTPNQLRLLNLCRLHLKVYLLSDLATGDGKHIDKTIFHRQQPFGHHERYRWPPVGRLNKHAWTMWQEALLQCFTLDHHQYPYRLRQPLGAWTCQRLYATTYFSPSHNMIYQQEGINVYRRFQCTGTRQTRNPTYVRTSPSTELPLDAVPTTTEGNYHLVRHTGITRHLPATVPSPPTWWGVVTKSTLTLQELIQSIQTI